RRAVAALLEALRVAHPPEHVADGIADGEPVEVVGLEPAAAQAVERRLCEQRERAQHRLVRARVPGDVEAEPVLRDEERLDGPVAAVALVPDAAAVLQLDERLERGMAV